MPKRRGHNEGSIYQTKDGKWRGAVSLGWSVAGKQRRKYVTGTSRADVSRKISRILADHQRGIPVASN